VAAQVKSASYAEEAARSKSTPCIWMYWINCVPHAKTSKTNKDKYKYCQNDKQPRSEPVSYIRNNINWGRAQYWICLTRNGKFMRDNELEAARYDIYNSLVQFIQTTGRTRQAYQLNHLSIQGFEVQP
jgi:adhesin transport system outer membrane protein